MSRVLSHKQQRGNNMFDPTKLESPLNHVIDSITPNIDKIVLQKDTTRVVSLKPTAPYYNTQATVHDYDIATSTVNNTRDVNYNRIDIGKYIESRAKVNTMLDGTSEYVLVSSDIEVITRQAGITLVTAVLNNNYDLPIIVSDLTTIKSEHRHHTVSSFGNLYMLTNGIISGNTLTYISGDVVVYNLPDTTRFSYNKIRTTRRGMSFYREWIAGGTIEITMPHQSEADGWSIQIEDVSTTDHIGNGVIWLHIGFNSDSGCWVYKNGEQEHTVDGTLGAQIKLSLNDRKVTVVGKTLNSSDGYITVFEDVTATSDYNRGLNRITMYSNNPTAGIVNFEINTQNGEVVDETLIENTQQYYKQLTTIKAAESSNALFGKVKYPIMVTRYDNEGYTQPKIDTVFVGKSDKGYVSSVDTFTNDLKQVLEFNVAALNELLKNNEIESFTFTILNKDNVNFRRQITCKPIILDGVITSIEVLTIHNGELIFTSNKIIGEGDANIVVSISNYEIQIDKDVDILTKLQTHKFGDIVKPDEQLQFLVRLDITTNNNVILPTISITKTYSSASNT